MPLCPDTSQSISSSDLSARLFWYINNRSPFPPEFQQSSVVHILVCLNKISRPFLSNLLQIESNNTSNPSLMVLVNRSRYSIVGIILRYLFRCLVNVSFQWFLKSVKPYKFFNIFQRRSDLHWNSSGFFDKHIPHECFGNLEVCLNDLLRPDPELKGSRDRYKDSYCVPPHIYRYSNQRIPLSFSVALYYKAFLEF